MEVENKLGKSLDDLIKEQKKTHVKRSKPTKAVGKVILIKKGPNPKAPRGKPQQQAGKGGAQKGAMGLKPTKGGGVQKATPKSNVRGRNLPAPGGSQRNRPVNNPKRHVLTIAGGPVKPTFRPILPRPKGTFNVHAEGSKIPLSERFEKINKPRPQPGMPQRFDGPSGANGRRRNAHGVVLPV